MIATALEAAIAAAATILVSVVGLIGVLIQQNRMTKKVDQVYEHVNKSEQQMGVDGEPQTFREEMRAGFKDNAADHVILKEAIGDHEVRIEHVEHEIGER